MRDDEMRDDQEKEYFEDFLKDLIKKFEQGPPLDRERRGKPEKRKYQWTEEGLKSRKERNRRESKLRRLERSRIDSGEGGASGVAGEGERGAQRPKQDRSGDGDSLYLRWSRWRGRFKQKRKMGTWDGVCDVTSDEYCLLWMLAGHVMLPDGTKKPAHHMRGAKGVLLVRRVKDTNWTIENIQLVYQHLVLADGRDVKRIMEESRQDRGTEAE